MKTQISRSRKIFGTALRLAIILMLVGFFALEAYTVVIQKEGDQPLPPLFGNFPANRAVLEKVTDPGDFSFAVVGDTRSFGTFEGIVAVLRQTPLDFGVLLGDCAMSAREADHRYFRAECAEELALPFPVFFVAGNHDIDPKNFPVQRFEELYGPSIFSFEYRQCLFIVLRVLNDPPTNEESLEFLRQFKNVDLGKYRHTFAFIHIPPPVTTFSIAKTYADSDQFVALFDELAINYVFAGDFHGWAQSVRGKTIYTITGGGGAYLSSKKLKNQFHHAMVIRVTQDTVESRIIYVPHVENIEDHLESFAITMCWPWMQKNTGLLILLNILAVAILLIMVRSLICRFRKQPEEIANPSI